MPFPESIEQEKQSIPEESSDSRVLELVRRRHSEIPELVLTREEEETLVALGEQAQAAEQSYGNEENPEMKQKHLSEAISLYEEINRTIDRIKEKQEPKEQKESQVIQAENEQGETLEFNLEEIRENWVKFYEEHHLLELAEALPDKISLTREQIEIIKEKAKQGFNLLMLLPPAEIQQEYLKRIKRETSDKPLSGLPEQEQYTKTYLSDTVKSDFPKNLKTLNRPEAKPYLLFLKKSQEVPEETLDKSPKRARAILKDKGEAGLTLSEYFLFQRDFTEKNQVHPETQYYTFLLDSEVVSSYVLYAGWNSVGRRVKVFSFTSDDHYPFIGFRSSAILEI